MFLLSVDWIMFTLFGPQLPVEPGASLSQVVGEQNAKREQMLIIGPTTHHQPPSNLDGQGMSSFKVPLTV